VIHILNKKKKMWNEREFEKVWYQYCWFKQKEEDVE